MAADPLLGRAAAARAGPGLEQGSRQDPGCSKLSIDFVQGLFCVVPGVLVAVETELLAAAAGVLQLLRPEPDQPDGLRTLAKVSQEGRGCSWSCLALLDGACSFRDRLKVVKSE